MSNALGDVLGGWVLEYDFHVITAQMEVKEIRHKREHFDKVEDLIATYRAKKNALVMGVINYNKNFKVYKTTYQEIDISQIEALM